MISTLHIKTTKRKKITTITLTFFLRNSGLIFLLAKGPVTLFLTHNIFCEFLASENKHVSIIYSAKFFNNELRCHKNITLFRYIKKIKETLILYSMQDFLSVKTLDMIKILLTCFYWCNWSDRNDWYESLYHVFYCILVCGIVCHKDKKCIIFKIFILDI